MGQWASKALAMFTVFPQELHFSESALREDTDAIRGFTYKDAHPTIIPSSNNLQTTKIPNDSEVVTQICRREN